MKLLHGDCLNLLAALEPESIDLILADPPYGTTRCKWDSAIPLGPLWRQLKRVIKPNGAIVMAAGHPTQKPVAPMEYMIKTYTNPGETVLDFSMGSGTTGVAAVRTGREFIGPELDRGYFDVTKGRINPEITKRILNGQL